MASAIDSPPQALKEKLADVKSLLKTANNRLQEEVSKHEIFTTKASASASSSNAPRLNGVGSDQEKRNDMIRTITDISTLESVLSCPIFDRIVNVTDSLDQLSYQLNLHPSITEFDIDVNSGELILTPPLEFMCMKNVPNQYSDQPLEISLNLAQNTTALVNDLSTQHTSSDFYDASNVVDNGYIYPQRDDCKPVHPNPQKTSYKVQKYHMPSSEFASSPINVVSNTEKLNSNRKGASRDDDAEPLYLQPSSNEQTRDTANRRKYTSNGHFSPDCGDARNGFQSTQSVDQVGSHNNEQRRSSHSNDLYKTSHGLNQHHQDAAMNQHYNNQQQIYAQKQMQLHNNQQNYQQQQQQPRTTRTGEHNQRDVHTHNPAANGRLQINQTTGVQYNRGSCSPSSAGSTVRLADECDSGASSYQSQQAKGSLPSYQSKGVDASAANGSGYDSVEQELLKNLSLDLERIKITLERDERMGLGITIAGYTLQEDEEISGIFIRSVTPGSPADRCGKIKEFDQIFSVNGNELVGYSNDEAVSLLRQSGKVVTLELMRHSDEMKHNQLKASLSRAECPFKSKNNLDTSKIEEKKPHAEEAARNTSPVRKSSIPVPRSHDSSKSPTKPPISPKPKTALVQVSTYQESSLRKAQEAIYKNHPLSRSEATPTRNSRELASPLSPSHIPVAAQRGSANKVIETKQGSRNTIDIKSPVCHKATATYVNQKDDLEQPDSTTTKQISMTDRLQREASVELSKLVPSEEPEWDKDATIIVLKKDKPSQGLGLAVKEYANPRNPSQPIIMITSITPGGIADRDGRLSVGDLLIFLDDKDLRGQALSEAIKALKKTDGESSLGVLKLKRR